MNPLNYMQLHDHSNENPRQHWTNVSNGKISQEHGTPILPESGGLHQRREQLRLSRLMVYCASNNRRTLYGRSLNFWQCVERRRWCPWAREGLEEARVFAGDEPRPWRGDTLR